MTELEKLYKWLLSYAGWGGRLYLDHTDGLPGSCGLYPKGIEEVSRQQDLMGNLTIRYRSRFVLQRLVAGQSDNGAHAKWLQDFQQWVQQQDGTGLTPKFGDGDQQETLRAENGYLRDVYRGRGNALQ